MARILLLARVGDLRPLGRLGWLLLRLGGVPYGISFYGWDLTSELERPVRRDWKAALATRVFDGAAFLLANSDHMAALAASSLPLPEWAEPAARETS